MPHKHHAHTTCVCRWGLQALYISWLIPAPAVQAPATATFLSGLGFCGLDPGLLQALKGRNSGWDAAGSSGGCGIWLLLCSCTLVLSGV